MNKIKLAIITTHPIQYYAPFFRKLHQSQTITPRVFYTWSQTESGDFYDREFGVNVGWDVPLLTGYDYQFVRNTASKPGTHHFFGIRNPGLTEAITAWGADAVLVYGWNKVSHLQALRYFKGRIPVFFRGDSNLLDPRSPLRNHLRRLFLSWIYRHVDVAISVGENNRDYYRWLGMPDSHIAFAPHCINNEHFDDPHSRHQHQANQWRSQLGIATTDLVIVFAGKLIPKKDPALLLKAFIKANTTAHLVFFGNGELEAELRNMSGSNPRIHFMPFQNQSLMPAVYRTGDLFVLPSCGPGETWGLALNEAMASHRPVIASSMAGGARDLVQSDQNGWVFTAGNVNQLSELIHAASLLGKEKLQEMGTNASIFIQNWSTDASAASTADIVSRYCMEFSRTD